MPFCWGDERGIVVFEGQRARTPCPPSWVVSLRCETIRGASEESFQWGDGTGLGGLFGGVYVHSPVIAQIKREMSEKVYPLR